MKAAAFTTPRPQHRIRSKEQTPRRSDLIIPNPAAAASGKPPKIVQKCLESDFSMAAPEDSSLKEHAPGRSDPVLFIAGIDEELDEIASKCQQSKLKDSSLDSTADATDLIPTVFSQESKLSPVAEGISERSAISSIALTPPNAADSSDSSLACGSCAMKPDPLGVIVVEPARFGPSIASNPEVLITADLLATSREQIRRAAVLDGVSKRAVDAVMEIVAEGIDRGTWTSPVESGWGVEKLIFHRKLHIGWNLILLAIGCAFLFLAVCSRMEGRSVPDYPPPT